MMIGRNKTNYTDIVPLQSKQTVFQIADRKKEKESQHHTEQTMYEIVKERDQETSKSIKIVK